VGAVKEKLRKACALELMINSKI